MVLGILSKDGHELHLEEIDDWNVVQLRVNGEIVFKCDIRQLDFGKKNLLKQFCFLFIFCDVMFREELLMAEITSFHWLS